MSPGVNKGKKKNDHVTFSIPQSFLNHISQEIETAKNNTRCISLLFLRLYGYSMQHKHVSTNVLRSCVTACKRNVKKVLRSSDILVQIGNEWFGIILLGADKDDALLICKKLADAMVKRTYTDKNKRNILVQMAFGYSTFPQDAVDANKIVNIAIQRLKKHARAVAKKNITTPDISTTGFCSKPELNMPRISNAIIDRPRLLNLFQSNKNTIVITAGPGFGKTTIVYQYTNSISLPSVWIRLTANHENPYMLLADIITNVRILIPKFGNTTHNLIEERIGLHNIMQSFKDEIDKNNFPPAVLIIDDIHMISGKTQATEILAQIYSFFMSFVRTILTSRDPIPDSIRRYIPVPSMLHLQEEDLRFSLDETYVLADQICRTRLSRTKIKKIWEYTRGWSIGTVTMLAFDISTTTKREDVFRYISEEFFNRLSPSIRKIIIKLSHFPYINNDILRLVTKKRNLASITDTLRQIPFLEGVPESGKMYAFHPLFVDYLREKSPEILTPQEYRSNMETIGTFHKNQGDCDNAIICYIEARNYEQAIAAIKHIGIDRIDSGHVESMDQWMSMIPQDMLKNDPELNMLQALVEERLGHYDIAMSFLKKTERQLRKTQAPRDLTARFHITKATIMKDRGQFRKAILTAAKGCKLSRNLEIKVLGYVILSLCLFHDHRFREAIKKATHGLRLADRVLSPISQYLLNNLGTMYLHTGNFVKAKTYFERCIREARQFNRTYQLLVSSGNYAKALIWLGDFASAENTIHETLTPVRKLHFHNLEIQNLNSLGLLRLIQGRTDEADAYHKEALQIAQQYGNTYLLTICNLKLANLHSHTENTSKTLFYLKKCEPMIKSRKSREFVQKIIIQSHVHLKRRHYKRARKTIYRAQKIVPLVNATEYGIQVLFLQYAVEKHINTATCARSYLKKAMHLIEKNRCTGLLAHELSRTPDILTDSWVIKKKYSCLVSTLRYMQENGRNHLTALLQQLPERHARSLKKMIQPLSSSALVTVKMFGEPSLTINNKLITGNYWHRRKVKQLLCLLLLNKNGITKDKLQQFFWPTSSRTNADRNFWNTVYYLRKTLDPVGRDIDTIVRNNDRIKLNPGIKIHTDIDEFIACKQKGTQYRIKKSPHKAAEAYEQARSLYTGDLMESYYEPWIEEKQHYYKNQWINVSMELSKIYSEQNKQRMSYDILRSVLQREPTCLEAMKEVLHLGKNPHLKQKSILTYRQFTQYLKTNLRIEPTPDLRQLYNDLTT